MLCHVCGIRLKSTPKKNVGQMPFLHISLQFCIILANKSAHPQYISGMSQSDTSLKNFAQIWNLSKISSKSTETKNNTERFNFEDFQRAVITPRISLPKLSSNDKWLLALAWHFESGKPEVDSWIVHCQVRVPQTGSQKYCHHWQIRIQL